MKLTSPAPFLAPTAALAAAFGTAVFYLNATNAVGQGAISDSNPRIAVIAAADVDDLVAPYAPDALLEWVGGPLDGTYRTEADRRAVWTRFAVAQGPLTVTTTPLDNLPDVVNTDAGRTVTANVVFVGSTATLKVRHTQIWRRDRLVAEIWHNFSIVARR